MSYIPYKEVSLNGKTTRHYVISPAGDVVCSTHEAAAAEVLARILNSHAGEISGKSIMELDWAALNEERQAAA
jgi:hypothetical protein